MLMYRLSLKKIVELRSFISIIRCHYTEKDYFHSGKGNNAKTLILRRVDDIWFRVSRAAVRDTIDIPKLNVVLCQNLNPTHRPHPPSRRREWNFRIIVMAAHDCSQATSCWKKKNDKKLLFLVVTSQQKPTTPHY